MAVLTIERLGGLAGFGGTRARIRSRGQIDTSELSDTELQELDALFNGRDLKEAPALADAFRFQITRTTDSGTETIVAPESVVPEKIAACVKDDFV